jgi:Zn finger protein HypA/HybF involved in hydrogenase expression
VSQLRLRDRDGTVSLSKLTVTLVKLFLQCPICSTRFEKITTEGTKTVECPKCGYNVGTVYGD